MVAQPSAAPSATPVNNGGSMERIVADKPTEALSGPPAPIESLDLAQARDDGSAEPTANSGDSTEDHHGTADGNPVANPVVADAISEDREKRTGGVERVATAPPRRIALLDQVGEKFDSDDYEPSDDEILQMMMNPGEQVNLSPQDDKPTIIATAATSAVVETAAPFVLVEPNAVEPELDEEGADTEFDLVTDSKFSTSVAAFAQNEEPAEGEASESRFSVVEFSQNEKPDEDEASASSSVAYYVGTVDETALDKRSFGEPMQSDKTTVVEASSAVAGPDLCQHRADEEQLEKEIVHGKEAFAPAVQDEDDASESSVCFVGTVDETTIVQSAPGAVAEETVVAVLEAKSKEDLLVEIPDSIDPSAQEATTTDETTGAAETTGNFSGADQDRALEFEEANPMSRLTRAPTTEKTISGVEANTEGDDPPPQIATSVEALVGVEGNTQRAFELEVVDVIDQPVLTSRIEEAILAVEALEAADYIDHPAPTSKMDEEQLGKEIVNDDYEAFLPAEQEEDQASEASVCFVGTVDETSIVQSAPGAVADETVVPVVEFISNEDFEIDDSMEQSAQETTDGTTCVAETYGDPMERPARATTTENTIVGVEASAEVDSFDQFPPIATCVEALVDVEGNKERAFELAVAGDFGQPVLTSRIKEATLAVEALEAADYIDHVLTMEEKTSAAEAHKDIAFELESSNSCDQPAPTSTIDDAILSVKATDQNVRFKLKESDFVDQPARARSTGEPIIAVGDADEKAKPVSGGIMEELNRQPNSIETNSARSHAGATPVDDSIINSLLMRDLMQPNENELEDDKVVANKAPCFGSCRLGAIIRDIGKHAGFLLDKAAGQG